jgi:linoleoyl-CoA desaturase
VGYNKRHKKLRDHKNEGAILNSSGNYKPLFYKMLISKVIYYVVFLVLPLVFIPLAWYWVLAGFLVMHFTSGLILSTIFQTAHVVPTSEYPLPDNNINFLIM